jgi:HEAT repeat protein
LLLLEDLTTLVLWLLFTVVTVNVVFLCFLFYRRISHNRYYIGKDAARERYRPIVDDFAAGALNVDAAAALLQDATGQAERDALEEMLLAVAKDANTVRVTELLFAIGFVERWARTAFGRKRAQELIQHSLRSDKARVTLGVRKGYLNFVRRIRLFSVPRALAVDHLGRLEPNFSIVFSAEALHDPGTDVRQVAIYSMGQHRHPVVIPLLLKELEKAIAAGNDVSLRTTKSTLICYRLEDLYHFVPYLSHPNWRLRFFVVDTVREISNRAAKETILNKNDFSAEIYEAFLQKVATDKYPDVRARGAAVIGHFGDGRALLALRQLLRDDNEFVRLHAVRACADRRYADIIPDLVKRMSDPRWRVREAAAKALTTFGVGGVDELYKYFVGSTDQYSSEQISEEIQRAGLTQDLVAALVSDKDSELAAVVCQKMALLGKTSLLFSALLSPAVAPEARLQLMEALAMAPTDDFVRHLGQIRGADVGPLGARADFLLQKMATASGAHLRTAAAEAND